MMLEQKQNTFALNLVFLFTVGHASLTFWRLYYRSGTIHSPPEILGISMVCNLLRILGIKLLKALSVWMIINRHFESRHRFFL